MSEPLAEALVLALALYAGVGLLFAIPFAFAGAGRLDPDARAGSLGFRLLIIPGSAALWPLLAWRWMKGRGVPAERNAHRDAAGRGGA